MTDREGYLRAILEHPDDDNLRLQYADVIEDNGESERAEFVRVSVELARMVDSGGNCECGGKLCIVNKNSYPVPLAMCIKCSKDHGHWKPFILRRRIGDLWVPPFNRDWIKSLGIGTLVLDNPNVGVAHSGCRSIGIVRRGFVAEFRGTWDEWQRLAPNLVWLGPSKCEKCSDRSERTRCEWCGDSGRMADEENENHADAMTDCTHCEANSRQCRGCTYEECPGCRCELCRGTGEIPGATVACGCSRWRQCDECCNSGRIPAPFPADTVQPIECVTITDFQAYRADIADSSAHCRRTWPTVKEWRFEEQG